MRTIYLADSEIKPKQDVYLVGLFMLCRVGNGMMELRSIITKRSHDRTWYRIVKDMQVAGELITKNKLTDWVLQIVNALAEFKAYKQKKTTSRGHYAYE